MQGSTQKTFEQQRGRGWRSGVPLMPLATVAAGFLGAVGLRRRGRSRDRRSDRHLAGLEEAGYVVLHGRRLAEAGDTIDHLLIGPGGVFVVQTKPWRGQLAVDGDRLFVDGRLRDGGAADVARVAVAVQRAFIGDLKPLGVTITPILCFPAMDLPLFKGSIRGVAVTGGRGLSRAIRARPVLLTSDQVLEIAMAADELLLPATRPRPRPRPRPRVRRS
ncbi:MAG TPA: nuclease-related domain-containing protein [Candidatus Caenarcaniphilales bacterium]|nr:nuclease-related domain-containing protein [Candidatus Caenarcaniphilales bacterium]